MTTPTRSGSVRLREEIGDDASLEQGHLEKKLPDRYPGYWDGDQLYDLRRDPNEQQKLAAKPEYARRVREMRKLLSDHLAEQPGRFGEF